MKSFYIIFLRLMGDFFINLTPFVCIFNKHNSSIKPENYINYCEFVAVKGPSS